MKLFCYKSLLFVMILIIGHNSRIFAQKNTFEELISYQSINDYIVIRANVGGREGNFLLDPRGSIALTEAAAKVRKIKVEPTTTKYPRTGYQALGKGTAFGFFIGKNVYLPNVSVVILKEHPLLKTLGVDGVINFSVFANVVLTINNRIKTLTISSPYRPNYMKLTNRGSAQFIPGGVLVSANISGKTAELLVDFYEDVPLLLSKQFVGEMFPARNAATNKLSIPKIQLANELFLQPKAFTNEKMPFSIIGKDILNKGIISFDLDKHRYYFQGFGMGEDSSVPTLKNEPLPIFAGKVNSVDRDYFLNHIYDYRKHKEWKVKGDKPVVIDFWAAWCGPCLQMMPIMEEMAAKYKDQILFYKVNIDKEGELRDVFKANAIPLLIFAPLNGKAETELGVDTKEKLEERIKKLIQ